MSMEQKDKPGLFAKAAGWLGDQPQAKVPLGEVRSANTTPAAAEADRSRSGQALRRTGAGLVIALDRARLREEGFLAPEDQRRQMADEYRRIKRPLLANAFGVGVPKTADGNLILVTSAVPGEGKTHTCINLALSLAAERDRTVLLVDGDAPKPHISTLFGVDRMPGLLDALAEGGPQLDELLIPTDIPRLTVLPAGKWTEYSTELLASKRMFELCHEMAQRYPDRIVLIDSPPLLASTEGQVIAAIAGQVVMVVAENSTARDDVRSALALLDEQKPINAILNKSERPIMGGYYYGGYGYGSYGSNANTAARPADSDGTQR
jgi:exopolysaccharide/PEP-CTERM locus tyrosine autokinase